MRKLALIVGLVLAAIAAPGAGAGIDVAITAPAAGAHSLSGVVPVMISASADAGIYSVQLEVDGVPYGIPDSSPIGPYQYEIEWDTGGIPPGDHTLTVLATDWSQIGGGAQLASGAITVDVGPPYPTVSLTAPLAYTFVKGTVQLAASAAGGFGSTTVGYAVDLAPLPIVVVEHGERGRRPSHRRCHRDRRSRQDCDCVRSGHRRQHATVDVDALAGREHLCHRLPRRVCAGLGCLRRAVGSVQDRRGLGGNGADGPRWRLRLRVFTDAGARRVGERHTYADGGRRGPGRERRDLGAGLVHRRDPAARGDDLRAARLDVRDEDRADRASA